MSSIPQVLDNGEFVEMQQPLTKPYLGFYVKNHSVKQVKAYMDGTMDACSAISSVMQKVSRENLTLEEFKSHLNEVLTGRYELFETMSNFVAKAEADRANKVTL